MLGRTKKLLLSLDDMRGLMTAPRFRLCPPSLCTREFPHGTSVDSTHAQHVFVCRESIA